MQDVEGRRVPVGVIHNLGGGGEGLGGCGGQAGANE